MGVIWRFYFINVKFLIQEGYLHYLRSLKKKISLDDLEKGFKLYLQNDEINNRDMKESYPSHMYT